MPIVNPGLRRVVGLIGRLFNGASMFAPLTKSIILQRGTGSPTFTRATTATGEKYDPAGNLLFTALAGEARFDGARRVRNLIATTSEDFSNAAWTKLNATVVANQATAPNGTLTADLVHPATSGTDRVVYQNGLSTSIVGNTILLEGYAKYAGIQWLWFGTLGGGTTTAQLPFFDLQNGVVGQTGTYFNDATIEDVGDGWYRCVAKKNSLPAVPLFPIYGLADADANTTVTANGTDGIYLWGAQLEDVTGHSASHQVAGEYVSVGGLDYRSDADPLYLSLPGTSGHCASTPDAVANSGFTDITVVSKVLLPDWTPATAVTIAAKWGPTAATEEFLFRVNTDGTLIFNGVLADATTGISASSTAGTAFSDGGVGYVAMTRAGGSGNVNFYKSVDGVSWSLLGSADRTTTAGALNNSATTFTVGANSAGGVLGDTNRLTGNVYYAKLYNGILDLNAGTGATLASDFNPHRDATTPTGTITSSTTGEVWTINGASSVVRNQSYHGSGVDGVKCFDTDIDGNPLSSAQLEGYKAEPAATNLEIQSQAFDNARWVKFNSSIDATKVTDPFGTTLGQGIICTAANVQHGFNDSLGITISVGGTYTLSFYLKAGLQTSADFYLIGGGGRAAGQGFTLTGAGAVVAASTADVGYSATGSISPLANGWYRCAITVVTVTDASVVPYLFPKNGAAFVGNGTVPEIYVFGAQLETGSVATSYIPTTTIAVARNADVLTYPSAGNIDSSVGTAYAEINNYANNADTNNYYMSGSGTSILYTNGTDGNAVTYDGVNAAINVTGTTFVNTLGKIAARWGAGGLGVTANGQTPATASFDGAMDVAASFYIGNNLGTTYGHIKNVRIWGRALSDSELKAITQP